MEIEGAFVWPGRKRQSGLSIIELLIAMVVLSVGMGGVLVLFTTAIAGNNRAKIDTQAVQVSQTVLEALSAAPADTTGNVSLSDCASNPQSITTAAGGSALNASGDIDWTKARTTSYYFYYVSCGARGTQATYEVRWQISTPYSKVKLINVSSRLKNAPTNLSRFFSVPVTLRTMAGSQ